MKRILAAILILSISLLTFASCLGGNNSSGNGDSSTAKIRIGALSGPTGMGMAKMINDNGLDSEKYAFTVFGSPEDAKNAFVAGDVDAICFPTNTAANLFGALKGELYVAAINCLGSLYLLSDNGTPITSVKDLEGKTVYTSVATSTTKPILDYILQKNDVDAKIEIAKDHDTLVAMLASGEASIAVLPEPKVTAALMTNKNYSVRLNLSEEWDKVSSTPLTMGCIVVRNDFLENHKSVVDKFLKDYKDSIEYVGNADNNDSAAQMIVSAGVLPKLPIAKGALTNLYGSIVYQDGNDMKSSLKAFYTAIGLNQPSDEFYYEK